MEKNPHDIFIYLNGAIEFPVWSKRTKVVALVKWFIKKEAEKIQEEHHQQGTQLEQAITESDNQIKAIQYENIRLQGKRSAA